MLRLLPVAPFLKLLMLTPVAVMLPLPPVPALVWMVRFEYPSVLLMSPSVIVELPSGSNGAP
jgi:hypothetical protein